MIAVAGGVAFFGYWLFAYGLSQVRGCNAGFLEIVWPGSYKGCNPDSGVVREGPSKAASSGTEKDAQDAAQAANG